MTLPWIVNETNAATSTAIGTWWLLVATSIAAAATVSAVVAAFTVQNRQFNRDRDEKEAEALRRSRAGWVAVNQALTMLELLLAKVRDAGAETPVNWGFLRVGTRGALAAANQALVQEIPNLDMLNLAIHAQTLANSFNDDLERRAADLPGQAGEEYIEAIRGLEESLVDQQRVAARLKNVLTIEI